MCMGTSYLPVRRLEGSAGGEQYNEERAGARGWGEKIVGEHQGFVKGILGEERELWKGSSQPPL